MSHKKQVGVRGKIVQAQGREIIANVLKFMKKEAAKGTYVIPVTSYKQRVMEATGISEKIYRQICKEMGLIEAGVINSFSSPSRSKKSKPKDQINVKEEEKVGEIIQVILQE